MKDKINGSLVFDFGVALAPWDDCEQYLTAIDAQITVWSDDEDEAAPNVTVGRMKMVVVKLAEAFRDNADYFITLDIEELESLFKVLFKEDGVFWPHFNIQAPLGDLLVIEQVHLDEQYEKTDLNEQAIETAISTFASIGIVVIKKQTLRLGPTAWSERGYVDLEFQNYLLLDNFASKCK